MFPPQCFLVCPELKNNFFFQQQIFISKLPNYRGYGYFRSFVFDSLLKVHFSPKWYSRLRKIETLNLRMGHRGIWTHCGISLYNLRNTFILVSFFKRTCNIEHKEMYILYIILWQNVLHNILYHATLMENI